MDITKIFTVLCGFLLIICLTLSITCLVVMRNAVDETSFWQNRAEELVNNLENCVQEILDAESEDLPVIAPETTEKVEETPRYCLRLEGDGICIYDAEGYLIKQLQTSASLLPTKEREKLASGIWVDSWAEVDRLLQDYE